MCGLKVTIAIDRNALQQQQQKMGTCCCFVAVFHCEIRFYSCFLKCTCLCARRSEPFWHCFNVEKKVDSVLLIWWNNTCWELLCSRTTYLFALFSLYFLLACLFDRVLVYSHKFMNKQCISFGALLLFHFTLTIRKYYIYVLIERFKLVVFMSFSFSFSALNIACVCVCALCLITIGM